MLVRDQIKFRVGQIVYLAVAPDEKTIGIGFPREEREAALAAEPEKFFRPRPSDERMPGGGCAVVHDYDTDLFLPPH